MSDFNEQTLAEVALNEKGSIISGPFGSNISSKFFVKQGIPVIRGNNLTINNKSKFIDSGFVYVSKEKAKELNCFAIQEDIIFTAAGTIGQVGIIGKNSRYQSYVISNKQMRVRLDKRKVNPDYVYYWLSSSWVTKELINKNTGSTVPLINLSIIKSIKINLPKERYIQDNIANLLNNLDKKIELNNRINAELEAMAKTLYDYWFVQFDFPNEEGKPYKRSGGKMVYNTTLKREIPEGWEVKTLDKISIIKAGGDKPKTYSKVKTSVCPIPIYSNSITDYGIYGYTNKAEIVEPSITISARGTIGVGFLRIEPFTPIIRLIVITPYKKNYLKYIDEYLRNIQIGSSGSVQRQLTIPEISLLNIICPEQSLLDKYNNLTSCIVEKIENVKKENLNLQSLRDWLLPMLMNGQVTVK